MIDRFSEMVSASSSKIPDLRMSVRGLFRDWLREEREPLALVDFLFLTAEYVDNEFYAQLRHAKAFPDHVSVLHLRYYDDAIKNKFREAAPDLLEFSDGQELYQFATHLTSAVIPQFAEAYVESPTSAYLSIHGLIRDFIESLQRARRLLPGPARTKRKKKSR